MGKRILALFLLPLLFTACNTVTPTVITNLTPAQQPRNASGLYPVEVALSSRQQTLMWETIKPAVVIGNQFYPMRPTALMKNRWETLIPIPPGKNVVYYRIKFDYNYKSIPNPKSDSKLSQEYQLKIVD